MTHVLLIDADKRLRATYAQALETAGHTVAQAASAQSALAACEEQVPGVIVLELQLQGHSGVELLQELRSYPEWADIPVALHTLVPQHDLRGFEDAFRTFGIIGYRYKLETTLKQLLALVDEALTVKQ